MARSGAFQPSCRVLLAALLAPVWLGAGESTTIRGLLVDGETGAPVAGAEVLVRSTPLGALTDEEGRFEVARPDGGVYTLVVVAEGFRTVEAVIEPDPEDDGPVRIWLERLFFEVPGLTVTANRGTHPGDAPTSVAVISGDELQRREATNLNEALPFAQGVTFNAGQMDIRGSSGLSRGVGSRVLMLLDGHRTLSGVGSSVDFSVLPVLDVERIEIVKGPHSTLWGTNAMGGVVNVITRPPRRRSPDRAARLLRPLRHPHGPGLLRRPSQHAGASGPAFPEDRQRPHGALRGARDLRRLSPERRHGRLAAAGEGDSRGFGDPP